MFVLLLFTLAMVILPISSFFLSQTLLFEGLLGFERSSSGVGSAIVAVLMVHLIIAAYVWMAYNEEQPQTKED
jgi:NADH:ubiquinone oxidoreductase subunit 5 (subunit L)/multisubunit Na+/H+ antiporter MnhA subunit